MKSITTLSLLLALSASGLALAQPGPMMDMKDMDMKKCMDMKGMNMKGMDPQKCKDMMKGADNHPAKESGAMMHKATGVVKAVDAAKGTVTLAHGAIGSLNWPAMTMSFAVKDKTLFDKLAVGKKIDFELKKEGADYVVTAVK